jgi:hypothetical protein
VPQHIGAVTLLVPDYDAAISYFKDAFGNRWDLIQPAA